MREYISGFWSGLSQRGRAIISIVVVLVLLAAFYLALVNAGAFTSVMDSLDKVVH